MCVVNKGENLFSIKVVCVQTCFNMYGVLVVFCLDSSKRASNYMKRGEYIDLCVFSVDIDLLYVVSEATALSFQWCMTL